MAWVDQKNGLVADTVYCDNELVAKDVAFKLPEITFATAESQAMGRTETELAFHLADSYISIQEVTDW